jgi:hypothetical protein
MNSKIQKINSEIITKRIAYSIIELLKNPATAGFFNKIFITYFLLM